MKTASLSREAGLTLLLAAAWIGISGYCYGCGNQTVYIPQIFHRIDPALLASDWFVQTDHTHWIVFSLIVAMSGLFGLPGALLFLYVLTAVALVSGLRFLSRAIAPAAAFWPFLILVLQGRRHALGNNRFWTDFWQPNLAGVALGVWAIALWFSGRIVLAYLITGLTFYAHVAMGGALSLVLAILGLARVRRIGWRRLLIGWGVGGLVACGAVLPILLGQLSGIGEAGREEIMRIVAEVRHPHHHLPSEWPGIFYLRFFGLLAAAVFAYWRTGASGRAKEVMRFILVVLGLCAVAAVFIEWVPVPVVAELHFFRLTLLVKIAAYALIAAWLFSMLRSGDPARIAMVVLVLCMYSERMRLIALAGAAATELLRPAERGAPASVLDRAGAALSRVLDRRAYVLFVLLVLFRIYKPATSDPATHFVLDLPQDTPWQETCAWVREGTPREDVFITPPYRSQFRLYARRAIVADFKSFPWNEKGMIEWEERLAALSGTERVRCSGTHDCTVHWLPERYRGLSSEDFSRIAERYGASWVVTEGGAPLPFRLAYENGPFRVWSINESGSPAPSSR